jgi:septum formation protein
MIVLASQSPRRAELLEQIGIPYRAVPADIDESPLPGESPDVFVERIARAKALAVRLQYPDDVVLGSDTAVVLGGRTLGKPTDRDDGIAMLQALSGRTHEVLTGVAVVGDQAHYALSHSRVRFRDLGLDEIHAYWETGEPADKAGSYAIQGRAAAFVAHIQGSYSGIMGLPLFETVKLLAQLGIRPRWSV